MDSVGKSKSRKRAGKAGSESKMSGWKNMSAKVVGGPGGEGRRYRFGSTQQYMEVKNIYVDYFIQKEAC